MTLNMVLRTSGDTLGLLFNTRETVAVDTPDCFAISRMVIFAIRNSFKLCCCNGRYLDGPGGSSFLIILDVAEERNEKYAECVINYTKCYYA